MLSQTSLTRKQQIEFARNGFLILKGAISPEVCSYLVEKTWARLPPLWQRHDPESWTGDVTDSCHTASLDYRRGLLKFQKGDLKQDPVIQEAFGPGSPPFCATSALFGDALAPIRTRGLYPNIPAPKRASLRRFVAPHVEAHPATTIALTYLSPTAPGAGGLYVWPGSHRPLYRAFHSRMDFEATASYQQLFDKYSRLRPLELPGSTGDVVLIHHRLFHAPSLNRSDSIRFAFLCDYTAARYPRLCGLAPDELWEDWAPLRCLDSALRDAPCDYVYEPWSKEDEEGAAIAIENDSSINKRDASALARKKRAGETWLQLSDTPLRSEDVSIDPHGGSLAGAHVKVAFNGEWLRSESTNGFVTRLPVLAGTNRLVVCSRPWAKVWCKLVEVRSPLDRSEVLYCAELEDCRARISNGEVVLTRKRSLFV